MRCYPPQARLLWLSPSYGTPSPPHCIPYSHHNEICQLHFFQIAQINCGAPSHGHTKIKFNIIYLNIFTESSTRHSLKTRRPTSSTDTALSLLHTKTRHSYTILFPLLVRLLLPIMKYTNSHSSTLVYHSPTQYQVTAYYAPAIMIRDTPHTP